MKIAKQLPAEIFQKMSQLGSSGRAKVAEGKFDEAEVLFLQLWNMVPEPKSQWGETQNLAVGIAEFYLTAKNTEKALSWIPNLYLLAHIGDSSSASITEGRIQLLAGDEAKASELFQKVYDDVGKDAFRGQYKPYLNYVVTKTTKKKAKSVSKQWPTIPDPEAYKQMGGSLQLDDAVHEKITALCEEGDDLAELEKYDEAIEKYKEALYLIPRPVENWDASTWVLAAIGDAMFLEGDFLAAAQPLRDVMYCPGAVGNPFIRLRRGQVAFEKGNLAVAEKEFAEAYRLEGEEIFRDEESKYWEFLREKL